MQRLEIVSRIALKRNLRSKISSLVLQESDKLITRTIFYFNGDEKKLLAF